MGVKLWAHPAGLPPVLLLAGAAILGGPACQSCRQALSGASAGTSADTSTGTAAGTSAESPRAPQSADFATFQHSRPHLAGSPSPAQLPPPAGQEAALAANREATFLGVLLARQEVTVAAEAEGRIAALAVRVGDAVGRGQVLANLASDDLVQERAIARAALSGAQSEAQRARLQLDRARDKAARRDLHPELYPAEEIAANHGAIAEGQAGLETALARVNQEAAHVQQLDARLARSVLRAPIEGRVAQRFLDAGALVHPGTAVVKLISAHDYLLRFAVAPEHAGRLRAGLPVTLRLDAPSLTLPGRISRIAPQIDAASQMIFVEAELSVPPLWAARLRDGLVGRVSLGG